MKKTKTFVRLLCLVAILSASPAFAVVEPIKVLQYSLRNVQSIIEVIQNGIALETSIMQTNLQGTIGAIAPKVVDLGGRMEFKSFAPTLPSELGGIVNGKGFDAIPQVRDYVEQEMKSISLKDGVAQRDVLDRVNKARNLASLDAIQVAKETMAKSNKGPQESKAQLNNVASASDSQSKASQENAQSIQLLQNDAVHNQLKASALQAKVTALKSDVLVATQSEGQTFNQNEADMEKTLSERMQNLLPNAVKNGENTVNQAKNSITDLTRPVENAVNNLTEKAEAVEQGISGVSNQVNNAIKGA